MQIKQLAAMGRKREVHKWEEFGKTRMMLKETEYRSVYLISKSTLTIQLKISIDTFLSNITKPFARGKCHFYYPKFFNNKRRTRSSGKYPYHIPSPSLLFTPSSLVWIAIPSLICHYQCKGENILFCLNRITVLEFAVKQSQYYSNRQPGIPPA